MSLDNGHVGLEDLELLRNDVTAATSDELATRSQIANHLEQCNECSEMVEVYIGMFAQTAMRAEEACPDEDLWTDFAMGMCSEQKLDALVAHASCCEKCAAFLRLAGQAISAKEIVPEATSLASAGSVWQTEMAQRLAALQTIPPTEGTKRFNLHWNLRLWLSWPIYSFAAVILVSVALVVWFRGRPSPDTLVARAYDARRLTELRIPGGAPVEMYSPVRGSTNSAEWPELLELKLAADRGLQKTPDSPFWHQITGRGLILQADPGGALSNFQVAYARDPMLPGIQFDLGSAYFELGDQTHDATNYGRAAEAFTRYLDELHYQDPVALFDRALCWKRMGMSDQARRDLEQALMNERRPDWQQVIRKEIVALQEHANPSDAPAANRSDSTDVSSALAWKGPAGSAESYESSLNQLFNSAFNPADPGNCSRFKQLALDGEAHRDFWVSDWLCTVRTSTMTNADVHLISAVLSNQAGQSDKALALAIEAKRLYSTTSNRAGLARAGFEQVYALQRAGRAQDCLNATPLASSAQPLANYSYLRIMMVLEEASCHEMAGSVLPVRTAIESALDDSSISALPGLHARALGFLAAYFTQQGLPEQGWNADVAGLKFCHDFACAPMRQYQFVSDLTDSSIALGLNKISIDLAKAGSLIAHSTGNLQIEAYALEVRGQRQLAESHVEDAKSSFAAADAILTSLGDTEASRQYRVDWTADRAQLLAREGHGDLALSALDRVSPTVSSAQSIVIQFNYWSQRALLERSADQNASALTSASKAVDCAERVLAGLANPSDREAWQARATIAYDALVDSLLRNHRDQDALSAWETHRAASEPHKEVRPIKSTSANYLLRRQDAGSTSTFIFARLIDRYAVFMLDANGKMVSAYSPSTAADAIDQLARTLAQLCADPHSQITDIQVAGKALYSILFSNIHPAKRLRIEADGRLGTLPFNALVLADGTYLGDHAAIALLPSFWSGQPQSHPATFTASSQILVVSASAGGPDSIPGSYDESREVAARFAHARLIDDIRPRQVQVLNALSSADIFHFSGHAIRQQGSVSLVLGSVSAEAISSAAFTQSSLRTCKLVVLAACSTLGSESYSGSLATDLPNTFLRAGTGSVVASLWQVDSRATRLLMLAFYDDLLKGTSPDIALSNAEATLSTNTVFKHPYYWSGFAVMQS